MASSINRCSSALPVFLVAAISVVSLCGCSEDASSPELVELPSIEGALVPESAEEGTAIEIEIWGTTPDPGWSLERFEVQAVSDRVLLIVPIGHRDGEARGHSRDFRGSATLEAPGVGIHTIRIRGTDRDLDFPIHVYPRDPFVRLLVRGGADSVHEELVVGAGWAMAFRRGESHPIRIDLTREEVERIRSSFREHRFFELEPRYIGDEPGDGLFFDLHYREGDRAKRVVAEERHSPESLLALVGDLRALIDRILHQGSDRPGLVGWVTVEPIHGEASVERTIRLTIANRSDGAKRLVFPTSQIYDFAVFGRPHDHDGHPGDDGPDGDGHDHHGDDPPEGDRWRDLVWNWAHDHDFLQVETELLIEPGEERSFEEVWTCVTNDGRVVEDGPYGLIGIIPGHPRIPIRRARVMIGSEDEPLHLRLGLTIEPVEGSEGTARVLTFTIQNPSDHSVTLDYPDDQHYDFHISDPRSMRPEPIWSWSYGKPFTDQPTVLAIPGGERLQFTERWDGRSNEGSIVPVGDYAVVAVLTMRHPLSSDVMRIRITR